MADHTTYTGEPGSILVKTDVKGNVYSTDAYGGKVNCPCETKTQATIVDTGATISNMIGSVLVSEYETGIDWVETAPVQLNVPFGPICN